MRRASYRGIFADTSAPESDFGFKPHTSQREGLRRFSQLTAQWQQKHPESSTKLYKVP
ncbi:MAG: hypothetical protein J6R98_02475 [Bacteroidaceae bacterium]|nr:hypothetical protein [Bacteroidaceae bacterium]